MNGFPATFERMLSVRLNRVLQKVNDYIIVAISSEGTVRNGSGDTIKMELMDILKGDYINPHVSIWWYKLDSIDELEIRKCGLRPIRILVKP